MGIDLANLAAQGRAYSAVRPWEPEELEAVLTLQKERSLNRVTAADYVRNGIMSVEEFDNASKKNFKPKSLDEAHKEAEEKLKKRGVKKTTRKKVAKKK